MPTTLPVQLPEPLNNEQHLHQSADKPGPDFGPGTLPPASATDGSAVGFLPSKPAGYQKWHQAAWFTEWQTLARRDYHGLIPESMNYESRS